jgi:hypothetical protein
VLTHIRVLAQARVLTLGLAQALAQVPAGAQAQAILSTVLTHTRVLAQARVLTLGLAQALAQVPAGAQTQAQVQAGA